MTREQDKQELIAKLATKAEVWLVKNKKGLTPENLQEFFLEKYKKLPSQASLDKIDMAIIALRSLSRPVKELNGKPKTLGELIDIWESLHPGCQVERWFSDRRIKYMKMIPLADRPGCYKATHCIRSLDLGDRPASWFVRGINAVRRSGS